MSIVIKNASILTQNKKRDIISGDIYIENNEIINVSKKSLQIEAEYKIDGKNKLVLPGLINTHTHVPMTLFRGYADDMLLDGWLKEKIWPLEVKLNSDYIEIGTKLGLLEMVSSGTTTFLDMYFYEDVIGKISEKFGVRGFLGFAMIDSGTPEYKSDELISRCESFVKKWKNKEIVTSVVAPHATYTCGPELLQKSLEISDKYGILMHTHCSETRDEVYDVQNQYGLRPVGLLKKYGLLNEKMILAHCGWITKNEIFDLKKYQTKVSHCPVSNMKIGTGGYTPVPELLDSEITVGLGTDGAASNNTLDMFDTMKFCALVHKQHRWDPKVLPAQTVLDFATIQGAKILDMENKIGSIEEGKNADIIMIDLNKPHLTPIYDFVSHIVYAAKGSDVCTTIINGKPIMLDYNLCEIKKDEIINDAVKCAKDLTSSF